VPDDDHTNPYSSLRRSITAAYAIPQPSRSWQVERKELSCLTGLRVLRTLYGVRT